jgi:hypothetical protein
MYPNYDTDGIADADSQFWENYSKPLMFARLNQTSYEQ